MTLIEFHKVDMSVPLNLEENRPPYAWPVRFRVDYRASVIDLAHNPSIIPPKLRAFCLVAYGRLD